MVEYGSTRWTRRATLGAALGTPALALASQPEAPSPALRRSAPSPMDWGANGRGNNDDTDAWQKAIDAVRGNAAYPPHETGSPAGVVFAPAGRYTITRSLDFTTDGSLQGLGIWGEGQLQTFLQAELTEAHPALDMTGLSGAHLRNMQIRGSRTSKASCAVLLAMDPGNSFHNRYPSLRDVWLELATDAPSAVAALVVAASDLAMMDNVVCSGPVGATMGWRLPARLRFALQEEASATGFQVAAGAGRPNATELVGYPVRITSGRGRGQIRRITAFDAAIGLARVDRAWETAPDRSSKLEVSKVTSRYRLAQARYDQTNYWIRNCQFVGKKAFVFTGGVAINVDDSYFAAVGSDPAPRTIISIEDQDPGEDQGPLTFHARGIRTENQSAEHRCYAITTAQPNVMLDVSGELTVSPASDPGRTSGAVLHNVAPGGFDSVSISGIAVGGAPLFDCTGDIFSLWSSFRADSPGKLDGRIGFAVADWRNSAADSQWVDFLLARSRMSVTPAGLLLGKDATTQRTGWDRSALGTLPVAVDLAGRLRPYKGNSGLLPCRVFDVPAAMLDGTRGKRQLHAKLYGRTAGATRLGMRLSQGDRAALFTANLTQGESPFAIELLIEAGEGGRASAGGAIACAASSSPFFGEIKLDVSQAWSIECCIDSGNADPIVFGPSSFLVT